jgi:hypothetical protein
MFSITDLFQWERFVSHTLVGVFYWLAVALPYYLGSPVQSVRSSP